MKTIFLEIMSVYRLLYPPTVISLIIAHSFFLFTVLENTVVRLNSATSW